MVKKKKAKRKVKKKAKKRVKKKVKKKAKKKVKKKAKKKTKKKAKKKTKKKAKKRSGAYYAMSKKTVTLMTKAITEIEKGLKKVVRGREAGLLDIHRGLGLAVKARKENNRTGYKV